MYNLLDSPLFGVRYADNSESELTLSGLLAALSKGEDIVLTACRRHQRMAVHTVLCQIAAYALNQAGTAELPDSEATWTQLLLTLPGGRDTWELVQPSSDKIAFMQAPAKSVKGWNTQVTPDEIDALNSSPNHSLKSRAIVQGRPEHWVYALVSAQTQSNTINGRYPGASRSAPTGRIFATLAPDHGWGRRFVRDVRIWMQEHVQLCRVFSYNPQGHALLWTLPWELPLQPRKLHPFYIDLCRKVRLGEKNGRIGAWTSQAPVRIDTHGLVPGITGDIWTPVVTEEKRSGVQRPESVKLTDSGITYEMLHAILFKRDRLAGLEITSEDGPEPLLTICGIARYQGKTMGYHERTLPVPASRLLEGAALMGWLSQQFLDIVGTVRGKVLWPAVESLRAAVGKTSKGSSKDPWQNIFSRFEERVDGAFFETLFTADPFAEETLDSWQKQVLEFAETSLKEGLARTPLPSFTRWKWWGIATGKFRQQRFKIQPEAST